jgi:WS/DGAT/MGAT family acyltransferase
MSMTDLDAVRARLGATHNDLILTIVSGAMHRWHTSHGADVQSLRAMMPVSLRGSDESAAGNRIGLLAVELPTGEPNPLARLRTIQARTARVKADKRAAMYPLLARVMNALPLAIAERLSRQQTSRANFVCTNVPGPRHACYMAGELIEQIYPYAPLVGDHPVAVALYSYRDTLHVGLDIDPVSMDDLPRFRDAIAQAYDEMLSIGRRAGVERRQAPRPASRTGHARGARR